MKILACEITQREKKDLERIVSKGSGLSFNHEEAKHLLSIAEVPFDPYSIEVYLDTDSPCISDIKVGLAEVIFGKLCEWDIVNHGPYKHKFKITVEKAD